MLKTLGKKTMSIKTTSYDLAIVGGGIVGLAHALAASRRGLKTILLERDAQPVGASIRNFGFVTVTGQQIGQTWQRALRSRDIWAEIAPLADIPILQTGLLLAAHSPEAMAVIESFCGTEMGSECAILTSEQALEKLPYLQSDRLLGALWSPHERRVESRQAIPKIANWLQKQGVVIHYGASVREIALPYIETTMGTLHATACVVCPGHDLQTLYPDHLQSLQHCQLHMLRLADPGFRLPCAVMSDLGLVRYLGYAERPEAQALRHKLQQEQPLMLENGIHLIVVQSADGSLVVGDSHHYGKTLTPFAPAEIDQLILDCLTETLNLTPQVSERWLGTYASGPNIMERYCPAERVRMVVITSGTGASTAFAIAEETLKDLFD